MEHLSKAQLAKNIHLSPNWDYAKNVMVLGVRGGVNAFYPVPYYLGLIGTGNRGFKSDFSPCSNFRDDSNGFRDVSHNFCHCQMRYILLI